MSSNSGSNLDSNLGSSSGIPHVHENCNCTRIGENPEVDEAVLDAFKKLTPEQLAQVSQYLYAYTRSNGKQ